MSEKWPKLEVIQISVQGLEHYLKVPGAPAGVPQLSSEYPMVIILLLGKGERKK